MNLEMLAFICTVVYMIWTGVAVVDFHMWINLSRHKMFIGTIIWAYGTAIMLAVVLILQLLS